MASNTKAVVMLSAGADSLEAARTGCVNAAVLRNADLYSMGTFRLGLEREQALILADQVGGEALVIEGVTPNGEPALEVGVSEWLAARIKLIDKEAKRRHRAAERAARLEWLDEVEIIG